MVTRNGYCLSLLLVLITDMRKKRGEFFFLSPSAHSSSPPPAVSPADIKTEEDVFGTDCYLSLISDFLSSLDG